MKRCRGILHRFERCDSLFTRATGASRIAVIIRHAKFDRRSDTNMPVLRSYGASLWRLSRTRCSLERLITVQTQRTLSAVRPRKQILDHT